MNGFNGYNGMGSAVVPYPTGMGWQQNQNMNNSFGTPQMTPQTSQQDTVIDWVMGRSGAEAYQLRPNTNAFLMDSNNSGETVYTKSTDMSGRYGPLRSFKMVPFEEQSHAAAPVEPIDYDKIRAIISDEVSKQMDAMTAPQKKEGR